MAQWPVTAPMADPLETVDYLARSPHRGGLLTAFREAPQTRGELVASADASRVTVDRVLEDFETRGWVDRRDGQYRATPKGRYLAGELGRLQERLQADGGAVQPRDRAATDPIPDDIGFLARSSARFELLDALVESPRSRRELADRIAVSRPTLSRLLGELDERDWIDGTNGRYGATSRGRSVAIAFDQLLSNLAAADALEGVLGWLPIEAFDFDLARLHDAAVVAADWDDPTASIHHVAELVRGADRARIAGPGVTREVSEAIRALTIERGGAFEGITDADALAVAREDETIREALAAVLDSGRATLYEHPGELPPYVCSIIDDAVVLCGHEDRGPALQAVVSDDATVRSWAESWFTARRAEAEPVDEASFTA